MTRFVQNILLMLEEQVVFFVLAIMGESSESFFASTNFVQLRVIGDEGHDANGSCRTCLMK